MEQNGLEEQMVVQREPLSDPAEEIVEEMTIEYNYHPIKPEESCLVVVKIEDETLTESEIKTEDGEGTKGDNEERRNGNDVECETFEHSSINHHPMSTSNQIEIMTDGMDDIDIVEMLLQEPFSMKSFAEKKAIIEKGRSTPALPNLKQVQKKWTRHFQITTYDSIYWLTGSTKKNALYCWNCLLFGGDRNSSWTSSGYTHLGNFSKAVGVHESSLAHIRASISLSTFGKERIEEQFSDQAKLQLSLHNEKVRHNREILKRLINAVSFLANQELEFRGNDEIYLELLSHTAEYDAVLKNHLENSTVFKGASSRIQNDLIDSIAHAMRSEIKTEVEGSKFVAVMADEMTDVSNKAQFSLVYRYIHEGKVVERFITFCDVNKTKTAGVISEIIVNHINDFADCGDKLVAQVYDGATATASDLKFVQAIVKRSFRNAMLVHWSYAHVLNLVLSQSASSISYCRIFFATLSGLAAFFSMSPKRSKLLDEFLNRRLPKVCATRWNYSSQLVNTVFEKKKELRQVFTTMLEHSCEIEQNTLAKVEGHLHSLESFMFCFLLGVFSRIFSHTDVLFSILEKASMDIGHDRSKIEETLSSIQGLRERFEDVYNETVSDVGPPSMREGSTQQNPKLSYELLYMKIFDNVEEQMSTRFQDYERLKFLTLLDSAKFPTYTRTFPTEPFCCLIETYGTAFFDEMRLKNELIVAYSAAEFANKSPYELLILLTSTDLGKAMTQLLILTSLVTVIPVSTASVERSFSALKRIKSFSRNKMGEDRLSNLGLISIESGLLKAIKDKNSFFEKVIEHFASSERRMDFTFK